MRDKEYIKLFDLVQESDGYQIKDLPFMTTAKETGQNLVCNEEGMHIEVIDNVMVLKGATLQTVFHYSDGTTSESEDTTITQYSYDNEKTLTSVEIGTCVTSIGDVAFSGCGDLVSVTIPDGVVNIGETAFYGCYNLTSVVIPSSVTSIANDAFSLVNRSSYSPVSPDITFEATTPISMVNEQDIIHPFDTGDYATTPHIHVPVGYENTYATHDAGWEALAQYIVRP